LSIDDGTIGISGCRTVFHTVRINDGSCWNRPIVVVSGAYGWKALLVRIVVATAVCTPRYRAPVQFNGIVAVIGSG
jgi:hypothetical protein